MAKGPNPSAQVRFCFHRVRNRSARIVVNGAEFRARSDRPKLTEALKLCRLHNATLIIAKLDRLARKSN
jgi:DNA invertase Pin-like site-specific DNA recombinase